MVPIPRCWITSREADELSLYLQTVYSLFYRGKLPGARFVRAIRIDLKALEAALEQTREKK